MNCPECGHRNLEELDLCEKCGEPLGETGIRAAPTPDESSDDSEVTGLRSARSSSTDSGQDSEAATGYQPAPSPHTSRSGPSAPMGSLSGASAGATGELPAYVSFGNRYEILELLGEGGMGRVYKAWDRELEKVIALKTIRGEMSNNPDLIKRFKQELLLARKITHKNVIRIHDLGESEGVRFFTMEYIPGESLKRRVERQGKLPAAEVVPLVRQMLGALEEAHSQGVIHRDLKPENMMIDPEGVLRIMDFGIARSAQDTGGMTAQGMMIGTPDYMSPEQVRGEKADAKSDLFSFGVILYEMLTGQVPYQADTAASRVMMRLSKNPPPPSEVEPNVPKYLEAIAVKCLEVDRALRYNDAKEILADIARESVDRSLGKRALRTVFKSKAGMAAATAAVVAVTATLYFARPSASPVGDAAVDGSVTTLAVLPFTNASGAEQLEWMRNGLSEMLVTDISQSKYVRPVPGGRVNQVLRELGMADQSRFEDASLEAISQRAPAQAVLYGQYLGSGDDLRLDLTLRKAGSGVPIALKVEGSTSDVFSLVDEITARVKEHLDLTPEQLRGDTDQPIADVSTASVDALRSYQEGLAQLERGANQAAIPLLRRAAETDPDFAMSYAKLAEAYRNLGEIDEARDAIDRAKELSEERALPLAERYQIHAASALVDDDFETAAKSYGELGELYPEDPHIQYALARSYAEMGNLTDAVDAYQKVLRLAPEYWAALLEMGRAQVAAGLSQDAIDSSQRALESGQFDADLESMGMIHSILGVAFRNNGNLDQSVEHLNLSLDFRERADDSRGQAVTLTNLAQVYLDLGDIDKTVDVQKRALAIAREIGDREAESNVLLDTGITYESTGELDKALESYRDSLEIEMEREDDVNLANRLDHIAEVYRVKGQYADAMVYLQQAKTHLAKSGDKEEEEINLGYMGRVRRAQGQYDEALEALLAALPIAQEIEDQIGVAATLQDLAEVYAWQGRYADAYASLRQAVDVYTEIQAEWGVAEAKPNLGHLLVDLGMTEEAGKLLAEAQQIADAAHVQAAIPRIRLGQAALARAQGNYRDAAKLSEEAGKLAARSDRKEALVRAQIALGRDLGGQGKRADAERLLSSTRLEAAEARLRPLQAEAAAALAEVYLARNEGKSARAAATEAIELAEKFSGRPILVRAYSILGESLAGEDMDAAAEAYTQAASHLAWIRGSLLPEHVDSYMGREDIGALVAKAVEVLEGAGRASEVAPLKKWAVPPPVPDPS